MNISLFLGDILQEIFRKYPSHTLMIHNTLNWSNSFKIITSPYFID